MVNRPCPARAPRRRRIAPPAPAPPGFSPGDARGEAPCIRKLKISPFPPGRGGAGGWGKEIHDAAGSAGDQNRRAPRRGKRRQGYPATPGQAPRSAQDCAPAPMPPGFSPGDARGEAPCIRKPKISPFPMGEGGWGDGGKPCDMAGKSGDQNRRAPRRGQRRQGYPATPGQAPARRRIAPPAPAPPGFSPGDARGEAPCIRKPKNSPFPTGEERSASAGRGDGGKTL